jgi:Polyketide cyclase / dehydrase and lipid transport
VTAGPSPRLPRGAVERRLFVDAPPDVVWAALHDPSCPTWRDVRLHLDPAGPDWPAAGARRHARFRVGPIVVGTMVESLEARPARRFRVGINGRGFSGERRWELTPAAGGTRVAGAVHLESRSRVGRVFLHLDRGGIGPRLEAELAALKLKAEAAASRPHD